ncbi:MAG: shikimate kinase [Nitrospiraceae bacterium]|nr:shikimate kinase [Nitrospiraceae bacterium]
MSLNVILTGFMGVGKTSVGTGLANDLGFRFVDTDSLIEADQKITITEIFSSFGEPYFRDVETRIIKSVLEGEGLVVSTGGGAVIRDANRRAFKERGITICLTARPEVIYDRIKHETHRPLLQVPDPLGKIRDLLASREPFYRQADLVIDTSDKSVTRVLEEIKEKVRHACC